MAKNFEKIAKGETDKEQEEQKIVSMVLEMLNRAKTAKSKYVTKWKNCISAYTSEYFEQQLPDYKSANICNYVFSTIETIRPIMVAENPKFQAFPRLEKDFDKSTKVQQLLDYEWARTKMSLKIPKIALQFLQIGTSIVFLPWSKIEGREGNVKPTLISAFNFFPEPSALDIDDAEWVIYATYKNVGELIKMYPEKRDVLLKAAATPSDEELISDLDSSQLSRNQILVQEVYMRDYSTEETIKEEEGKQYKVVKLKYPKGRRILVAGDVLLSDGENPYDDEKFPFVVFKCYDLPSQFWGMGEVEQLMSPTKNANILTNQVLDNARMTANSQWIMDKNSGVEINKLTNRPGLIIRKNPGTEIKRAEVAQIPAYVQNVITDLKKDIEVISGVFDVTRGENPGSITAGVAINQLNESSQSRIKLKMQLMESALGELGSMWIRRVIQFWKVPRQMRVMVSYKDIQEEQQMAQQQSQMPVQGVDILQGNMQGIPSEMPAQDPMASMDIASQDIGGQGYSNPQIGNMMNMGANQMPIFIQMSGEEIDGDWDISVVAGSTMPVNKNARLQQYISLAQTPAEDGLPLLDRQTLLEMSEIPNVEEILGRFAAFKEQQQQQAQMQQDAQMQQQQQQMQMQNDSKVQEQLDQQAIQSGTPQDSGQQQGLDPTTEKMLQYLEKLPPEELAQLIKENPQIEQFLSSLTGNNPQEGTSQGGM